MNYRTDYRTDDPFDHGRPNESRANLVERALAVATDRLGESEGEPNGVFTDVSDLLAHVRHFCDRAGISYGEVDSHAYEAYLGDVSDGQSVRRDTDRFPNEVTA